MGRTPARGIRRTLSSSSDYDNTHKRRHRLERRMQREAADGRRTRTSAHAQKSITTNEMRSSDVEPDGHEGIVDTADEGDEEFVQTSSESDLDEEEEEEEKQLDFSSASNGLEVRHHTHRRTSMRLNNGGTETPTLHQRLRQSLRLRDQHGDPDNGSLGPTPESTTPRRQRRVTQTGLRDASNLFDGASVDQKGYASSPTTSVARRLRRGHADNVHKHSSLRNQMPPESPEVDGSNSDDFLSMRIDTPTRKGAAAGAGLVARKYEASASAGRRRLAPSLVASISGSGLEPGGGELLPPPPSSPLAQSRPQSRQQLALKETPVSPPPIIDKPREERSYKEFFPDLNVFMPMAVRFHSTAVDSPPSTTLSPDTQQQPPLTASSAEDTANQALSAASSGPLTSLSSMAPASAGVAENRQQKSAEGEKGATTNSSQEIGPGDQRQPSRSSSGLSIKLVFNDPEATALNGRHHTASLPVYLGMDPFQSASSALALRSPGPGKSTASYAGTPQSSVVVLAPKKPVLSLPESRFKRVEGKGANAGYKPSEFKRPEGHYIRNIELTETDLAERIEYDLDDADQLWLQRLNEGRVARGAAEVSANMLELMVDHMEKEWFELVKETQRAISAIHQEHLPSACAICGEEEGDNSNAIVFCDGCDVAVHQDCYGVPYIPEGQWLCRSCMLSPDKEVSCILCPQRGGAFKKTTTNKWVHLLCARWIPEVDVSNTVYMEPVDSIDQIPRSRWKLHCHLCRRKVGACIQCSQRQCFTAFHVQCARRAHLAMLTKINRHTGELVYRAFCERHTPPTHTHTQKIDLAAPLKLLAPARRKNNAAGGSSATPAALSLLSSDLVSMLHGSGSAGREQAGQHWPVTAETLLSHAAEDIAALYGQATAAATAEPAAAGGPPLSPGAYRALSDASLQLTMRIFNPDRPVLNEYVFAKVLETVPLTRLGASQRTQVVGQVARYWALKRSQRHGAPLLKRLHLEPWTASVTQQRADEMAEEQRQAFLRRIRTDLERVRLLVESVRRRERAKLKSVRVLVEYIRRVVDPLTPHLMAIVDELIEKRDPRGVLSSPVELDDAPDYLDVIGEPMDFGTVRQNIRDHKYWSLDEVERHLHLVVANCMAYNKPDTYYYQLATRVKRHVERLVAAARAKVDAMPIDADSGRLLADVDMSIFDLDGKIPPSGDEQGPMSAKQLSVPVDEEGASGARASPPAKQPTLPAPVTRSSRQNQPLSADPESAQARGKAAPSKAAEQPAAEAEAEAEAEAASAKTRSSTAAAAAAAPDKKAEEEASRPSKRSGTATPSKKGQQLQQTPAGTPRNRAKTPSTGGSQRKAAASRPKPQVRPLTLFEQLSVAPPDVRQRQRDRYSSAKHPDDDIPDDVNVLKTRLRRASMAASAPPPPSPSPSLLATPTKRPAAPASAVPTTLPRAAKKPRTLDTTRPVRQYGNGVPFPTAALLGEDSSAYAYGTPVWAKMASFPWFPASICDPHTPGIPEGVHSDRQSDDCNTLVWFFSSNPATPTRSWKWVSPAQVCKLGVDAALDEMFFRAQKAKSSSMVRGVRNAYAEACRETNTPPLVSWLDKR